MCTLWPANAHLKSWNASICVKHSRYRVLEVDFFQSLRRYIKCMFSPVGRCFRLTFYFVSDCDLLCPDTNTLQSRPDFRVVLQKDKTQRNNGNKQNAAHNWDLFCQHVFIRLSRVTGFAACSWKTYQVSQAVCDEQCSATFHKDNSVIFSWKWAIPASPAHLAKPHLRQTLTVSTLTASLISGQAGNWHPAMHDTPCLDTTRALLCFLLTSAPYPGEILHRGKKEK